jgi:hypothetical protein
MSHYIQGIVCRRTLLSAAKRLIPGGRGAALAQDFCFIPITDSLFDDLRARYPEAADIKNGFERLSGPVEFVAKALSAEDAVAYVETEYFGGDGGQAAIVWKAGHVVLSATSQNVGPINNALAFLGVDRRNHHDEFDALGLGKYRSNSAWFHKAPEVQGAG